MKTTLHIFILILVFSVVHSKNKGATKILRFSNYKLEYPKTWKTHKFNGYITIRPKNTKEIGYIGPNPIYVFPNTIESQGESFLEKIDAHASLLKGHEKEKNFRIIQLKNNEKYQFKIEYDILMDFSEIPFRQIEFISLEKSEIKYCYYIMRKDLFEKYYDEAMLIINSIQKR